MPGLSAVIFIPDDTAKTGHSQPLTLQPVLGAPLLAWLANALYDSGVGRFFLVSHDRYAETACACLPQDAEATTATDADAADLLHVFLSTAEEAENDIPIITRPTVYLPTLAHGDGAAKPSYVFSAKREQLMSALDERFVFSQYLADNCTVLSDFEGYYPVNSLSAAIGFAPLLRRDRMLRLIRQGVEIFDVERCDIEPSVRIEEGVHLMPGVILRGKTVIRSGAVIGPWTVIEDSEIGENTKVNASQLYGATVAADVDIGPFAHIRPASKIGRGAKIGNFVEVKNAALGENTWASHLSYLGDAQIGAGCNVGSGTATVNFDRVEKHRTQIGDNAFIGCHTALVAPVRIGEGAYIAAGSVITEDVPPYALGIARARQSNKRDWAAKHKRKL